MKNSKYNFKSFMKYPIFTRKTVLTVCAILFFLASGYSQIFTDANRGLFGIEYNRGKFDSTLYLPTGCGKPTDTTFLFSQGFNGKGQKVKQAAKYYDSCGHIEYVWDPSLQSWKSVAAASNISSPLGTIIITDLGDTILEDVNISSNAGNILTYNAGLYVPSSISNGLLSGGIITWVTGLTYQISAAIYVINGVTYSSPARTFTLAASDPSLNRSDAIVVTIADTAGVITGIPNTPAVDPNVNPASQLKIGNILVGAGTTAPTINVENIYLENTEWTTAVSNARINAASTNFPFAGTKDVEATAARNGDSVTFTKSGSVTTANFTTLTFQLRLKAAFTNSSAIILHFASGVNYTLSTGTVGSYAVVSIPLAAFAPLATTLGKLTVKVSTTGGRTIGFYIDNIQLQGAAATTTPPGNYVTNAGASISLTAGTFAARPTAGVLGRYYAAIGTSGNDSTFYYDNGTSWVPLFRNPIVPTIYNSYKGNAGDSSVWANNGGDTLFSRRQRDSTIFHSLINADGSLTKYVSPFTLTLGSGLLGTSYNGLSAATAKVDTSLIATQSYVNSHGGVYNKANFYLKDSSLSSNRTVDGQSLYSLIFQNVTNFTALLDDGFTGFSVTPSALQEYFLGSSQNGEVLHTNTSSSLLHFDGTGISEFDAYNDSLVMKARHPSSTDTSLIKVTGDSIIFYQHNGNYQIKNVPTGTALYALGVDATNHIVQTTVGGGGTTYVPYNGLYLNTDSIGLGGTLTKNDTLDGGTLYDLLIKSSSSSGTLILQNSGSGAGLFSQSQSGPGAIFTSATGVGLIAALNPSSTNTIVSALQIERETTGTAANGIGAKIDYAIYDNTNAFAIGTSLISQLTNATHGSVSSKFSVTGLNASASVDAFDIYGNGLLGDTTYGHGNHTGTATFALSVDASGNIIETTAGGGGSVSSVSNINGTLTISPTTGSVVASLNLANNNTWTGTQTFQKGIFASGNITAAAWGSAGINFGVAAATYTDNSSSGTIGTNYVNAFAQPTLVASSATVYTNAATVFIANAPANGTNVTQTSSWALFVGAGTSGFGGGLTSGAGSTSNMSVTGGTAIAGSNSTASLLFGGASAVNYRAAFNGGTSTTITAGNSYANTIIGLAPVTTPATGTNAWLVDMAVNGLGTVTGGGSTITNTASLYVGSASSAGTNNYSIYSAGGNNLFTGGVTLGAGTTSIAPINFTSSGSSLLTSATVGKMEVDANGNLYYTHAASERGVADAEQFISLTSPFTLTTSTSLQQLFNSTTSGQVTVAASTSYYFECMYSLTSMSATTGTFGFGIGGTATLTSVNWGWNAVRPTAAGVANNAQSGFATTASVSSLTTTSTTTNGSVVIRGIIRVNAGGTIIPQVSVSQSATPVVGVNSWFRMWPVGTNTVTNVGNWN